MITVRDVYEALFAFAPEYMKEDWDNVGLLCGRMDAAVSRVLVALDPADWVLREAKQLDAQLIVTHHPLLLSPVKSVSDRTENGRKLLFLAENGIAAMNLHTNLDCAPGGVNDVLAAALGLSDVRVLAPAGTDAQGREYGLIRVGDVPEQTLADFCALVSACLHCPGVRMADGGKKVSRVAVGGGSCAGEMEQVLAAGCDTFVTADVKYHQFLQAAELGLNLIDAGHFETENPVCAVIERILRERFPQLSVLTAQSHKDPTQFAAKC